METDELDENNGSEVRTLSLLTLADLAVALQDQGDDHNYARYYDVPQILDAQCLRVKEKDHNYSTCSRTELRGRAKYNMKKSSSEENLATSCTSENENLSPEDFSLITKKSHSCEKVTLASTESESNSSKCIIFNPEVELPSNKLCRSWPKENAFKEFMNDSISLKSLNTIQNGLLNQQLVCDHNYARDDNSTITCAKNESNMMLNDNLFHKDHNYDIRKKFSFEDPKKISLKKSKQIKFITDTDQRSDPTFSHLTKNNRFIFDHNYTYRTVQGHQPLGSVESLGMDPFESDTDSCEETIDEETKLHKQMINTQQDHPYSKSGILSF